MKTIQVLFKSPAPRTMSLNMHGFEGPAKKPISGWLTDGGRPLAEGDITGNYTVIIPADGNFEVIDTTKNREKLRALTKPGFRWQMNKIYDAEKNEYHDKKEKIELPIYYFITDGTSLDEVEDRVLEDEESAELTKEISVPRGRPKKGD